MLPRQKRHDTRHHSGSVWSLIGRMVQENNRKQQHVSCPGLLAQTAPRIALDHDGRMPEQNPIMGVGATANQ